MAKNTANYGNDSIRQLKDEERVRLRPAVIFGSDGLDGCAHAAFEILSNAVDEARQGYGKLITLTAFRDGSIQVEDNGRGCPLDWNPSEKRFNWELVFCELYAGGKYNNNQGGDYDFSLGTNGLGSCATQYASEYMDVTVWRDGNKYSLHFKKGKVVGAKKKALEEQQRDLERQQGRIEGRSQAMQESADGESGLQKILDKVTGQAEKKQQAAEANRQQGADAAASAASVQQSINDAQSMLDDVQQKLDDVQAMKNEAGKVKDKAASTYEENKDTIDTVLSYAKEGATMLGNLLFQ